MKKTKIFALLCIFPLLCSCCESETNESIETSAPTETITEAIETLESPSGIWDDWDIRFQKGSPLSAEELIDFPFEDRIFPKERLYAVQDKFPESMTIGDFLDTLDEPKLKDCFLRAATALWFISGDNIERRSIAGAVITISEKGDPSRLELYETGYTFDSFYGAYLSAFTEDSAQRLIGHYRTFAPYNGGLYKMGSTISFGSYAVVYYEYELLNRTESEISFRRVCYSEERDIWDYDKPSYDPEKKDEYNVSYDDFKFVKTADGWRAEEFMSALDESRLLNVWF